MLNFEDRTGPSVSPPVTYPDVTVAEWWRDAKFGIFLHWGIYSVPAWARPLPGASAEQAYTHHPYAEWIANTARIPDSPARKYLSETFGFGTSYEDLADKWTARDFDAQELAAQLARWGARYVIPTTKHHDGFCLWDTATTGFNSVNRGPRRDLIAELAAATRSSGMRFGVYFSGALDWHVSDFPPIQSNRELFIYRRNDEDFARYSAHQVEELIAAHEPDILWNDIEWPEAGKYQQLPGGKSVAELMAQLLAVNPAAVVNDRFGVPVHGHLTREYSDVANVLEKPWEATRGLGASFGYNQLEGPDDLLSPVAAISLLADTVAKNGNLLLNIGLTADGTVPEPYLPTLNALGTWLKLFGPGIYGTRPGLGFATEIDRLEAAENNPDYDDELCGQQVRYVHRAGSRESYAYATPLPEVLVDQLIARGVVPETAAGSSSEIGAEAAPGQRHVLLPSWVSAVEWPSGGAEGLTLGEPVRLPVGIAEQVEVKILTIQDAAPTMAELRAAIPELDSPKWAELPLVFRIESLSCDPIC